MPFISEVTHSALQDAAAALSTLVAMRDLVNARDDIDNMTGEEMRREYLTGPAWAKAEAALDALSKRLAV